MLSSLKDWKEEKNKLLSLHRFCEIDAPLLDN